VKVEIVAKAENVADRRCRHRRESSRYRIGCRRSLLQVSGFDVVSGGVGVSVRHSSESALESVCRSIPGIADEIVARIADLSSTSAPPTV